MGDAAQASETSAVDLCPRILLRYHSTSCDRRYYLLPPASTAHKAQSSLGYSSCFQHKAFYSCAIDRCSNGLEEGGCDRVDTLTDILRSIFLACQVRPANTISHGSRLKLSRCSPLRSHTTQAGSCRSYTQQVHRHAVFSALCLGRESSSDAQPRHSSISASVVGLLVRSGEQHSDGRYNGSGKPASRCRCLLLRPECGFRCRQHPSP